MLFVSLYNFIIENANVSCQNHAQQCISLKSSAPCLHSWTSSLSNVLDSLLKLFLWKSFHRASLLSYELLYFSSNSRTHLLQRLLEFIAFAACLHGPSHICISRWSVQGDVMLIWQFGHQLKVHCHKGVVYPQYPVYSILIFLYFLSLLLPETYKRNMLILLENWSIQSMLLVECKGKQNGDLINM